MARAAVKEYPLRQTKNSQVRQKVTCYTVPMASVITQVPPKSINQFMDRELEFASVIGAGFRAVRQDCLLAVRLNYELSAYLKDDVRVDAILAAMKNPRRKSIHVPGTQIAVRIDLARSIVSSGLNKFRRSMDMVTKNPDVLNGEPCVAGTRLSVYLLSDMFRSCGRDEVKETYPDLTDTQLDAAVTYGEMCPRRGRPPRSVEARLEKAKPHRTRVVRVKHPT